MKKKNIIFLASFVFILLIVLIFSFNNSNKKETILSSGMNNLKAIEDASNKILQTEANFKKLPIYTSLTEGNWTELKKFLENSDNKKLISWLTNKITEELINKGNLSTNITNLAYSKYLFDKFTHETSTPSKNLYMQNISKLISNSPQELEPLQEQINKAYYSCNENSNLKILLLESSLNYANEKAVKVFSDAISSKQTNIIIVAIRSVKTFSKNKYIENALLKLTKDKNISIQSTAYKVLGIHQNKNIEKNIPTLIASKNAYLVEAGIFVIKEMKLTSQHRNVLMGNLDNMDYFNRIKAQKLLDNQ